MAQFHTHHIIPKHAGGTDDPANLITVTVDEHAELHLKRYKELGDPKDRDAYNIILGSKRIQYGRKDPEKEWREFLDMVRTWRR